MAFVGKAEEKEEEEEEEEEDEEDSDGTIEYEGVHNLNDFARSSGRPTIPVVACFLMICNSALMLVYNLVDIER